jgi:hypothetical protein
MQDARMPSKLLIRPEMPIQRQPSAADPTLLPRQHNPVRVRRPTLRAPSVPLASPHLDKPLKLRQRPLVYDGHHDDRGFWRLLPDDAVRQADHPVCGGLGDIYSLDYGGGGDPYPPDG